MERLRKDILPRGMLPNFIIFGAGRSGTTSLYEYLRQHPQVFMSRVKEPNYFAFDGKIPDGPGATWLRATSVTTREAYEALFANAADVRAIGEASARYLREPNAAARIHALLPDVRLVAILRNPVERAFSTYLAHRRDGYDPAPTFEEALADQDRRRRERWPFGPFVDAGFAGQQLIGYRRLFAPTQLRIYLYEDLVSDARGLMRDLFTFLNVDASIVPDVSRRYGRTGVIRNPVVRLFWRHTQRLRIRVGPLLPSTWRHHANAWAIRDLVRPELRPESREALLRLYRDDTLLLQDLLGRDLSTWLT